MPTYVCSEALQVSSFVINQRTHASKELLDTSAI